MNKIKNISVGIYLYEAVKDELTVHKETFLQDIENYIFFSSKENISENIFTETSIQLNDDYDSATPKQFLCLKKQYELHANKCDWFYVCGYDTYLVPENAAAALKQFPNPQNISYYIGGHGDIRNVNNLEFYFATGGAGFFLSKKCLENIYPKIEQYIEEWKTICLKGCYYAACDVAIAYFLKRDYNLSCFEIPGLYHLNYNHYAPLPEFNKEHHNRYKLIAKPIAFHTLKPPHLLMKDLHYKKINKLTPFNKFENTYV